MNGWYMWQPKHFPPSECINPLFVSIHINPKCANEFFHPKTIDYLKKYEPIGARDKGTQALLEQHGIKSYYSSCLTLTLGLKYKTNIKSGKTIFVDPYIFRKEAPSQIALSFLKACWHLIKHPIKAHRLARRVNYNITRLGNYSKWLDRHLWMASFYEIYSKVFDDNLLFNADYVTHIVNNVGVSEEQKMEQARELIRRYAGAKLVVTSRIHAALPCLGLETPVIFIPSSGLNATRGNAGRFDGIEKMFNVIRWKDCRLVIESPQIMVGKGKITNAIQVSNPSVYKEYRDLLVERTMEFCSTNRD